MEQSRKLTENLYHTVIQKGSCVTSEKYQKNINEVELKLQKRMNITHNRKLSRS